MLEKFEQVTFQRTDKGMPTRSVRSSSTWNDICWKTKESDYWQIPTPYVTKPDWRRTAAWLMSWCNLIGGLMQSDWCRDATRLMPWCKLTDVLVQADWCLVQAYWRLGASWLVFGASWLTSWCKLLGTLMQILQTFAHESVEGQLQSPCYNKIACLGAAKPRAFL